MSKLFSKARLFVFIVLGAMVVFATIALVQKQITTDRKIDKLLAEVHEVPETTEGLNKLLYFAAVPYGDAQAGRDLNNAIVEAAERDPACLVPKLKGALVTYFENTNEASKIAAWIVHVAGSVESFASPVPALVSEVTDTDMNELTKNLLDDAVLENGASEVRTIILIQSMTCLSE